MRHGQKYRAIIDDALVFFCLPPWEASGKFASLCCHTPTFIPLLHPLLLRACLFLIGCCVSLYSIGHSSQQLCLFFFLSFYFAPSKKNGISLPSRPLLVSSPLNSPILYCRILLVGCRVLYHRLEAAESHDVCFYFLFFGVPFTAPNKWTVPPPTPPSPPASAIKPPNRFRQV